jgi:lipoyl(octanoyl) transferase
LVIKLAVEIRRPTGGMPMLPWARAWSRDAPAAMTFARAATAKAVAAVAKAMAAKKFTMAATTIAMAAMKFAMAATIIAMAAMTIAMAATIAARLIGPSVGFMGRTSFNLGRESWRVEPPEPQINRPYGLVTRFMPQPRQSPEPTPEDPGRFQGLRASAAGPGRPPEAHQCRLSPPSHTITAMDLPVIDLGRCPYARGFDIQQRHHAEILAARDSDTPIIGRLLLVEHDPVLTITRRLGVTDHLLAGRDRLEQLGIAVEETNRGGDITYHGPGQLIVYPIVDLNALKLRLHDYMRQLEAAVIDTIAGYGIIGERDKDATGVWIRPAPGDPTAKVAAMGVRVQRWITLHGLALNVCPDLSHFETIIPCGLAGRTVTSLERELGGACPAMEQVKTDLVAALSQRLLERVEQPD